MKKTIFIVVACLLLNFNQTSAQTKSEIKSINGKDYYVHIVKKGESLHEIGLKYNSTVNLILSENENAIDGIEAGMEIKIPVSNVIVSKQRDDINEIKKIYGKNYHIHIVKAGETIYSISKKYSTTEKLILSENENLINVPQIGQEIKIPVIDYELQKQQVITAYNQEMISNQKKSILNINSSSCLIDKSPKIATEAEYSTFLSYNPSEGKLNEICKKATICINEIIGSTGVIGYKMDYYSVTGKTTKTEVLDITGMIMQKYLVEYDSNNKAKDMLWLNYLDEIIMLRLVTSAGMKDAYFESPLPKSKKEALYRYDNPSIISVTETCPVCNGSGSSTGAVSGAKRCMGCNGAGKVRQGSIKY